MPVLNRGATVSFRALVSWRAGVSVPRVVIFLALVAVGGCGAQLQTSPSQSGGGLFARVFGEIGDLYLEPVSTRKLALSGLARLSRFDRSFGVSDALGGGALTVTYDERNIGYHAIPADGDNRQWGDLVTTLIGEARRVSPKIAALPPDAAEQAVLHGVTAALDRYSRYASPDVAQDQRAAREGFGGIGVTVDPGDALFRVTAVTRTDRPTGPASGRRTRSSRSTGSPPAAACIKTSCIGCAARSAAGRGAQSCSPACRSRASCGSAALIVYEQTVTVSRSGGILVLRVNSFNHSTTKRIAEALAERSVRGSSPASCLICAATRAGCSTRLSASPICSCMPGRSSR